MTTYALKIKYAKIEIYQSDNFTKAPISYPSISAARKAAGEIAMQAKVFDVRVVPYPKAKGVAS